MNNVHNELSYADVVQCLNDEKALKLIHIQKKGIQIQKKGLQV